MRGSVAAVLLGVLLAAVAVAATVDARGWSSGTKAMGTPRVLGPIRDEPIVLELPGPVARRVTGPTLLVYFSPSCPHCVRVAPEIGRLATRLAGKVTVLGVAAGGTSTPAILAQFQAEHGWGFEVLRDEDRAVGAAIGATSTPSALLVDRRPGGIVAVDVWYPYAAGTDVLVEMRTRPGDPFGPFRERTYVGNRACGACHVQELEAWLLSHHAIAWGTLLRADADDDPACVGCHVTGHGQPGGWTGEPLSHLVDVGCEACHGPGGPHDGKPTVPSSTCAACHDAKHSIAFSYEKGLPLLDHFRTAAMDDAALGAARQALVQGEAPRELLAFGSGERVGSAACASCHAKEHASWKGSPHAGAMGVLHERGAQDDAGCVGCHATAKIGGPKPTTVEGFRTDEGVGCEACHGPGGAHVAAGGGKENIVGLGESCPVCVIEAVCTSCHTKAWDPDWELERDLGRVRHAPAP